MVETFKLVHNLTNLDRTELFELNSDHERRHTRTSEFPLNIVSKRSNLEIRRHFFSNRIVDTWNCLPNDLKSDRSLEKFKYNLKQYLMTARSDDLTGDDGWQ